MICCSLRKAAYCNSPHSKPCPFLRYLGKTEVIDAKLGMNFQMLETFPSKLFNSFTVAGGFMVAMAVAFVGSTSIPLLWTRNRKNFPTDTSKAHFSGFILNMKSLHLSKTFLNNLVWSPRLLDFMTMSST